MGGVYIDPKVAVDVMNRFTGSPSNIAAGKKGSVSGREAEALRLIAMGYSNKEISSRLELSVKTVETHKANAMRKLGLTSRVDLVRYAMEQGWLQDT
jgi:DNA-binding NarL/FixJ family response regulator